MKLRMILAALSAVILTTGFSINARADWRGHRHHGGYYRPPVAVRVIAPPIPRVIVPPVVITGGYNYQRPYYGSRHRRHCGGGYNNGYNGGYYGGGYGGGYHNGCR